MTLPIASHLSTIQTDPLRNFKFLVNISHTVGPGNPNNGVRTIGFNLGFTSVGGFSATTNAIPYRQGGYNTTPQMIPGQTSFTPITFQRGLLIGTRQNFDWFKQLFAVTPDQGNYQENGGKVFRATVTVHVLPHPRTDKSALNNVQRFTIYNAWPTTIAYSDLNAGDNGFIVENMVLAHEGWDMSLAETNWITNAP